MGIDTVKLRSPSIDEGIAQFLERQCILKSGLDLASGELLYEITSGELAGSWDSRVSFRVLREDYVNFGGRIRQVPCEPFILIEASLHKFFYGQNVFGKIENFQLRIELFLELLGELLGCDEDLLPSAKNWQVRRVDWAEVYALTPGAIAEFFRRMNHSKFPRRSAKAAKYGVNAIYFPGTTTTLKLYHKGPEFKEHDRHRVRRTLSAYFIRQRGRRLRQSGHTIIDNDCGDAIVARKVAALQRLADNRLRVEVEIHAEKLNHDFDGRYPLVSEVTDEYLKNVHDKEVYKLLREGKTDMETVRTHDKVKTRLNDMYGKRSANLLFAFWLQLAARGEDVIRMEYSRTRFYANRKKLEEAGCSWLASNVHILPEQDTLLPRGFQPLRNNPRLCSTPVANHSVFNLCPVEWAQLKAAA